MEADEPALVVRSGRKKDDRWDESYIRQHTGHVVGHSRCSGGGRACGPGAACRARRRAIGNLCATHVAKCHWIPSLFAGSTSLRTRNSVSPPVRGPERRCGKIPENLT